MTDARALERLLLIASRDSGARRVLMDRRGDAAWLRGEGLGDDDIILLGTVPAATLDAMVAGMARQPLERRAFLGGLASVAVGAAASLPGSARASGLARDDDQPGGGGEPGAATPPEPDPSSTQVGDPFEGLDPGQITTGSSEVPVMDMPPATGTGISPHGKVAIALRVDQVSPKSLSGKLKKLLVTNRSFFRTCGPYQPPLITIPGWQLVAHVSATVSAEGSLESADITTEGDGKDPTACLKSKLAKLVFPTSSSGLSFQATIIYHSASAPAVWSEETEDSGEAS